MPLMVYLALEDPTELTRSEFVRLGLMTRPGPRGSLPYSERSLAEFEAEYCDDRFWAREGEHFSGDARLICTGLLLAVVGRHGDVFFDGRETGMLGQFKHQYFLLFLIAHFHKAALLSMSDELAVAMNRLEVGDTESVRQFKRTIRQSMEVFLRFTHRYWFHEVSNQELARAIFNRLTRHLGNDALYDEVRSEVADMNEYLDTDSVRRQANTILRLTVVTVAGLIGTVATGFLGMNLLAAADEPFAWRLLLFVLVARGDRCGDDLHRREVEGARRLPGRPLRRAAELAAKVARADAPAPPMSELRRHRGRSHRGHRPRHHRGHHRVSAHLEHRPPADRAALARASLRPLQHCDSGRRDSWRRRRLLAAAARSVVALPATRESRLPLQAHGCVRDHGRRRLLSKLAGVELPETVAPVAIALVLGGVAILAVERWLASAAPNERVTWLVVVCVGLSQVVAGVFPGTSRSAAAIFAAMLAGLTSRPAAAEFAFLVGIPTMIAAAGYELVSMLGEQGVDGENWSSLAIAFVAAAIVAFASVKWLLIYIRAHRFTPFAWYRIVFGVVLLAAVP